MNPKKFGGEDFGHTLAELKAMAPHAQTVDGVKFDGNAKKVSAILILAGLGGELIAEIERLNAELDKAIEFQPIGEACLANRDNLRASLGLKLGENLHEHVEALRKNSDRWEFCTAVSHNDAFTDALDPFMEWAKDIDQPETLEQVNEHADRCIQVAKDNGLWPIKPEPELTDEAQADRDDFEAYKDESGGCGCHLNPPCGY